MPETHTTSSNAKKRDKKNKKAVEKSANIPPVELKSSTKRSQAKEVNTEENNNLSISSKPYTNICHNNINNPSDEIIESNATDVHANAVSRIRTSESANNSTEQFDFDDVDLEELNDSEVDDSYHSDYNNKNNNEIEKNLTITDNVNDDQQQQQQKQHFQPDQITKEPSVIEHSDDCTNANPLVSAESSKRNAAPPAYLDLDKAASIATSAEEAFCPITPRRIFDVEDINESETPNLILRSSSSKAVISVNNETIATAEQAPSSIGDREDDEYYDDGEPDDELLVQFLGEANRIAEARLAARRQARAEAREIRMRELERQQKEQEQNADRVFDMHTASGIDPLARSRLTAGINSGSPVGGLLNSTRGNSMSSRRSSEDSLEEEGRSLRDIRHELRDVEERFRKAMIANAQLDNERASQTYQIQLLKDKLEEMEESYSQLQREFKEKSRDYNALKRNLDKVTEELKLVQGQLNERDTLITEQGLVIVTVENEDASDAKRALVSCENAHLLGSVQGSLDVRLKKFSEEKQQLQSEVQHLQEQLDIYKIQGKGRGNSMNGPTGGETEEYEAQREANKIISDYKYKLQKAEQEIANLQASLARSETQVIRYKSTAEAAEKAEAELKIERRKLQRENREAMERLEELETSNNHLLKRLDKLKNAKSALLKDL